MHKPGIVSSDHEYIIYSLNYTKKDYFIIKNRRMYFLFFCKFSKCVIYEKMFF